MTIEPWRNPLSFRAISTAGTYLDWILPAAALPEVAFNRYPDPAARELLRSAAVFRSVPGGTVLSRGSADCTGLLLIHSGQLRAYILSEEGREITLYRLFGLDLCLFSASCTRRISFCRELSSPTFVAEMSTEPKRLTVPQKTSSPSPLSTGRDSPVTMD